MHSDLNGFMHNAQCSLNMISFSCHGFVVITVQL